MKRVELLAPVGSMESLNAAIYNGADAVYLGGKLFNARQYASNFDKEELKYAIEIAHKRNVKVYITLNIAIKEFEIKALKEYLKILKELKPDALIVQDYGVINIIRKEFPELQIHASTQMTINNSHGVRFLSELGIERIVLARELNLEEIKRIKKETKAEIEVFVHGALCVSYSGQCLMSSIIGGRSGNRGRCAQTCRMPFSMIDKNEKELRIEGKYLISPKDLNTIENIDKLIDAGVDSFKIEGRMKKPEYVAIVVNKYRKAIDYHLKKVEENITETDKENIKKVFNRGFTKGFLFDDFGRTFISMDKPNNRGTYIGIVENKKKSNMTDIHLKSDLRKGDGLSTDNPDGSEAFFNVDKIILNGKEVKEAKAGDRVKIITYKEMTPESKIYKTIDIKLEEYIRKNYLLKDNRNKENIDFNIVIKEGKSPIIKAKVGNKTVSYISEQVAEKAKSRGITEERILEQISKLNDTNYKLKSIEIDLEENIFIPISEINSMRRKVVELLDKEINKNLIQKKEIISSKHFQGNYKEEESYNYENTKIAVSIENEKQLKDINFDKLSRIYVPELTSDGMNYLKKMKNSKKTEIYLKIPKIVSEFELKEIEEKIKLQEKHIDGVSLSNLGFLQLILRKFNHLNIHLDSSFNIYNSESIKFFKDFGIKSITLSPELNLKEIKELMKKQIIATEVIGYGRLNLMTMKNCPMAIIKKCKSDKECLKCDFKIGFKLRDRKNMEFPIKREGKTTYILNSKTIFIPEYLRRIKNERVSIIRIDFYNEDSNLIEEIQNLYYDIIKKDKDINLESFIEKNRLKSLITKGHYNRGVE